jgi:phage shock protein C
MESRLTRSNTDKMLGGVCGGLGQYFGIDSTLIRLFFAVGILVFGLSPLVYIILWIVMPAQQPTYNQQLSNQQPAQNQQQMPPAALPDQPQQDPTGEWRYDPYTGEPIQREQ